MDSGPVNLVTRVKPGDVLTINGAVVEFKTPATIAFIKVPADVHKNGRRLGRDPKETRHE